MNKKPLVISCFGIYLDQTNVCAYRQISGLNNYSTHVVTRKIQNRDQYPFEALTCIKKPSNFIMRKWRKLIYRKLLNRLMPISKDQALQMLDIANKLNADIIHVYMGTEAVQLLPYLRIEKRPKIVSFHGVDTSKVITDLNLKEIQDNVDLILVRCEHMKSILVERGCSPSCIRLNTTGVPMPEKIDLNKSYEFTESNPMRLVQSCRLIEKKGLDVTIKVIEKLKQKIRFVSLDIYGSGPDEKSLRKQVEELGLESNVRFNGFFANKRLLKELKNYHFFVHPSRETNKADREGIPNSMLEAMAYGVPVIATRHSGIPEVINHDVNGFLVESPDSKPIAKLILEASSSDSKCKEMAEAAAQTVKGAFSLSHNIALLEDAYSEVYRI